MKSVFLINLEFGLAKPGSGEPASSHEPKS
jgi:hypothetical protein